MAAQPDFMNSKEKLDFTDPNNFHDRVLIVGDYKFYVVSGVLSQWSEYFRRMFNGPFKEAESKEVHLKEVDVNHFDIFLHLLYKTKESKLSHENLISQIELSYRFLAPSVLDACKEFIDKNRSNLSSGLQLLKTAFDYNIEEIKVKLMKDQVMNKYTLEELARFATVHEMEEFKDWLCEFGARTVVLSNFREYIEISDKYNMPIMMTRIVEHFSKWKRMSILEHAYIDLLRCGFQYNLDPVKRKLRECIFFSTMPTKWIDYENLPQKRSIMINSFLHYHYKEINELEPEIKEFIIQSTITPIY